MSISRNIEYLKRLPDAADVLRGDSAALFGQQALHLVERRDFAPNPGELRMFTHVPANLPPKPALVVVLHGCAQSAAVYDLGSGWSQLADQLGFVLLFPQQRRRNNANMCFNWFVPDDVTRNGGETASICQMIAQVSREQTIDPTRIFITGLSAGGSMAAALLATHPDLFAAGAILAGVPYGGAGNVKEALNTMFKAPPQSARDLGERLRAASSHRGPWPRISIWQGSADTTVHPANADHLLAQWLDVHGLPTAPTFDDFVDGHPRYGWRDKDGNTVVETYSIRDMAHGAPLASTGKHRYGQAGPYMLDAGISSSYHIALFFGLTEAQRPEVVAPQRPLQSRGLLARAKRLILGEV